MSEQLSSTNEGKERITNAAILPDYGGGFKTAFVLPGIEEVGGWEKLEVGRKVGWRPIRSCTIRLFRA
jgi:hypothetical protein